MSENAEYDAAKEAPRIVRARGTGARKRVTSKSRVLDEKNIDLSTAKLLTTVEIENIPIKTKNVLYTSI